VERLHCILVVLVHALSLGTNQPPATFLSEQISTSHQPPVKRTGCMVRQCYAQHSAELLAFGQLEI
jgi:hypothetical protein